MSLSIAALSRRDRRQGAGGCCLRTGGELGRVGGFGILGHSTVMLAPEDEACSPPDHQACAHLQPGGAYSLFNPGVGQ